MFHKVIGSIIVPGANPLSFSGLQYWYDATQITPVADGTALSSWADLSGNSRTLTQATGSKQPKYKTARINSKPTVLFDGVDDAMATAGFSLAQPWHVIGVIAQPTFVANGRIMDGASGNTGGVANFAADSNIQLYAGSFGPMVAGPAAGTGFMFRAKFNGASSAIGIGTAAYVTGDASTGSPNGLVTGAIDSAGSAPNNVEFGELFAYNRILDAAEETALLTYLNLKWGT